MDLLHFKISKYGISIASRILGTEISLNNSDEYLGAGFLKTDFRRYFIVNFQNFSQGIAVKLRYSSEIGRAHV